MYKIQRLELLDELKIERSRRGADRISDILLLDQKWTYTKIGEELFIDEGTIANYKKRYRAGVPECLIIDDYKTRRTKLTEFEELELTDDIEPKIFLSTKEIVVFIKKNIKLNI